MCFLDNTFIFESSVHHYFGGTDKLYACSVERKNFRPKLDEDMKFEGRGFTEFLYYI
jgi:hypothetical protein